MRYARVPALVALVLLSYEPQALSPAIMCCGDCQSSHSRSVRMLKLQSKSDILGSGHEQYCLTLQAEELEVKLKFISEKVPNRIVQVMGSNAGAGSGEFHMYRMVSFSRQPSPSQHMQSGAQQGESCRADAAL